MNNQPSDQQVYVIYMEWQDFLKVNWRDCGNFMPWCALRKHGKKVTRNFSQNGVPLSRCKNQGQNWLTSADARPGGVVLQSGLAWCFVQLYDWRLASSDQNTCVQTSQVTIWRQHFVSGLVTITGRTLQCAKFLWRKLLILLQNLMKCYLCVFETDNIAFTTNLHDCDVWAAVDYTLLNDVQLAVQLQHSQNMRHYKFVSLKQVEENRPDSLFLMPTCLAYVTVKLFEDEARLNVI
jgi:hypothetical protein